MLHNRVRRSPLYANRLRFVNSQFTFSSALSRASCLNPLQRASLSLALLISLCAFFSGLKAASANPSKPKLSISSITTAEDFQAALNAADFGDIITLQAG